MGKDKWEEDVTNTCLRFVKLAIDEDKVPERDWLGAPLQIKNIIINLKKEWKWKGNNK